MEVAGGKGEKLSIDILASEEDSPIISLVNLNSFKSKHPWSI
ncbi:MAG: hypothetical protein QXH07_07920 [Thermoplasmata archaeon]